MGKGDILKKRRLKQEREKMKEEHVDGQITALKDQYDKFKEMLENYAVKEKKKINSDPLFRADFMKMCRAIGVDPLSSGKGAFQGLFSQTSKEYYYRLATQVSSICLVLKDRNGGYLSIQDCIQYLRKISQMNQDVSKEDVIKAIQVLGKDLKGTFKVIEGDII
jgi:ESCRT-II complex subunit VPS22